MTSRYNRALRGYNSCHRLSLHVKCKSRVGREKDWGLKWKIPRTYRKYNSTCMLQFTLYWTEIPVPSTVGPVHSHVTSRWNMSRLFSWGQKRNLVSPKKNKERDADGPTFSFRDKRCWWTRLDTFSITRVCYNRLVKDGGQIFNPRKTRNAKLAQKRDILRSICYHIEPLEKQTA